MSVALEFELARFKARAEAAEAERDRFKQAHAVAAYRADALAARLAEAEKHIDALIVPSSRGPTAEESAARAFLDSAGTP